MKLVLLVAARAVNPGAADRSLAASRAKVFLPAELTTAWRAEAETPFPHLQTAGGAVAWFDENVDALFRKRRLRSTCDSVAGFHCDPLAESRLEDLLWDARGLVPHSLYEYRLRKLLLQSPPPLTLRFRNGSRAFFADDTVRVKLALDRTETPSLLPLDWKYLVRRLSAEQLSRLLMAVEFAPDARPLVPARRWQREDHWVDENSQALHPVRARRKYSVARDSDEGRVLQRQALQDRSFNHWNRQFYVPGELVPECTAGGHRICPASEDPEAVENLLLPRSYSPGESDHAFDSETSIFGSVAGALPHSLTVALNAGLERTAGSLKPSRPAVADHRHEANQTETDLVFLLPRARDPKWIPSALQRIVSSDTSILAKLSRTHRTWPYLVAALDVDPELVERWVMGQEMEEHDVFTPERLSSRKDARKKTPELPSLLINAVLKLPQTLLRLCTLGLLHVAKLYVDLLSNYYTVDGVAEPRAIRQYREQIDLAISVHSFGKASALKLQQVDGAKERPNGRPVQPVNPKTLDLFKQYQRLVKKPISPIRSSSWEHEEFWWRYPNAAEAPEWLDEEQSASVDAAAKRSVNLNGAWHRTGLTSLEGEIHLNPPTVVTELTLRLVNLTTPEPPSLHIFGYDLVNLTRSEADKCFRQYRRGKSCENLRLLWEYALEPVEGEVTLNESHLVRGLHYHRVDMIGISWNRTATADKSRVLDGELLPSEIAPVPRWAEHSAPSVVRLERMKLHTAKQTFEVDHTVLNQIVALNLARDSRGSTPAELNQRADYLRAQILEFAKERDDLYETEPKEVGVALVVQPRQAKKLLDFNEIAGGIGTVPADAASAPESAPGASPSAPASAGRASDWTPSERFEHYIKYWGTLPPKIRFQLRSIGVDKAGVPPRGFQLPFAAQTAYDASLMRTAQRALHENRNRPFLTKEGSVVGSDLRKPDLFAVDIHVVNDLPVEAPLTSLLTMKKTKQITKFLFNEFAEGRLIDQTRKLDEKSREKLLEFLRSRLEDKMADLTLAETPKAAADGTKASLLKPASANERYEELGIHPQDEEPPLNNNEIDVQTASALPNDKRGPNVVEALRTMNVDADLTKIVTETLGEVEASVMDLIKDVTIIAVTEDPETGETISRKIQLDLNHKPTASSEAAPTEDERSIAFEIATLDAQGTEQWVELLVPIAIMHDQEAVANHIRQNFGFDHDESLRLAGEIAKIVEGYDVEEFDAMMEVLVDYDLNEELLY